MTEAREEHWTTRDGRRIAVGEMDVEHLRNTLRMLIRKARKARTRAIVAEVMGSLSYYDYKDMSDAQARRDLANPSIFFPLLDGGVYGSPDLQRKYGGG